MVDDIEGEGEEAAETPSDGRLWGLVVGGKLLVKKLLLFGLDYHIASYNRMIYAIVVNNGLKTFILVPDLYTEGVQIAITCPDHVLVLLTVG